MSNQRVVWSSSDSVLASVSASGVVTVRKAGTATIMATSGNESGRVMLDLRDGGPVGTGGGTLAVLDSAVTLTLPSGALPQTTVLLIRPVVGGVLNPRMIDGTAFEVGPETLTLARVGTVSVRYDRAKLAAAPRNRPSSSTS